MNPHIQELLKLTLPLPLEISQARANCFNAVQFFWSDQTALKFTSPTEFVTYIDLNFRQITTEEKQICLDVAIIWSRSENLLPRGSIRIDALNRRDPGYPFGLVIEHAFVLQDENRVFQKRDPSEKGGYEQVTYEEALQPYFNLKGFEITFHRRR